VCLVAVGCGRIGFDARGDGGGGGSGDAAQDRMFVGASQTYIKASNTDANDWFGTSSALSADGQTLVVSSYEEASAATTIDGNQADNSAPFAGAAYVFVRTGGTWVQQAYVKPSNMNAADAFGEDVALSADGNTLAIASRLESGGGVGVGADPADNSAPEAGAVYVFVRAGTTWTQQAYIKATNTNMMDQFGYSLALSADGSTLAVGAITEASNATGVDGNQADNSLASAGAVYVYTRTGTTWSSQAYIKASNTNAGDQFGEDVALSSTGDTLAVSAWAESSAAKGIDGNQADNTASVAGAVYVFQRTGTAWAQQAYIKASNTDAQDYFGTAIAISGDGNTLVATAEYEASAATGIDGDQLGNTAADAGAAYVFVRADGAWTQQAYVKASNTNASDDFGKSVALSTTGDTLAVAAWGEASKATGIAGDQADNSEAAAGAAYVFSRTGATWSQVAYVKATNTDAGDAFGKSITLSGDGATLAVGAWNEDSSAKGIGGNPADNTASNSGAVYVYQ
jgi:FG-GAP repeat protein